MKLVGERRALAAAVFAFFGVLYMIQALLGPGESVRVMWAITGCYGLAFFSLVAGYFWARWFAVGLGLFGVLVAAAGVYQMGPEPMVLVIGGLHLAATMSLWGSTMASSYDGQTAWRERYHMDDSAVQRLGRSVIRAGVSLPMVLIYAFAPKPASSVLGFAAFGLVAVGLHAIVKGKTIGVVALGAAGAMMLTLAGLDASAGQDILVPSLAGGLLVSATVPFAGPMLRALV
jgi:hypothetical protein